MSDEFSEHGYNELMASEYVSEVCKEMIEETYRCLLSQFEASLFWKDRDAGKKERARIQEIINEGTFEDWMDEAYENDITVSDYAEA